jgi:hypothetical protein
MRDNVYRFRRLKRGEPKKLKVLAEDLVPHKRRFAFAALVCVVFCIAFGIAYLIA